MTETVPTPPPGEAKRQKIVHALRTQRLNLAEGLRQVGFTDNAALDSIQSVNNQIDLLKYMREPYPDDSEEPSLDEIKARSDDWFWEPWDSEDEEDDEE